MLSPSEFNIKDAFEKAIDESKEMLKSQSALDLMLDAGRFHRQLMNLIDTLHLPAGVIIGVLTTEVYRLSNETNDLKYFAAFELFKKYVDENYIKKEKDI